MLNTKVHYNRAILLIRLLGAMAALLFSIGSAVAQPQQIVSSFVDRTEISLNEVITLTIRIDSSESSALPSLNLLNNDFDQLGISRNSTYTNNNGDVQSWNEYRISLRPRRTGALTIPAFRIGGYVTSPITINVSEQPQTSSSGNNEIFLETDVSKNSVYVQEQLIYTIKLHYTISFDQGAQLGAPQVDGAVIQLLGNDNTYQEVIDGIRYNVTERKYVIFPQSSGEITIEPVTFDATLGRRGGLSRVLSNRSNIRQISLVSDAHLIEVKGIPANFPGETWLPASNLGFEEEWSDNLDDVEVGDAVTRNLTLIAEGLSSSLLPEFNYPDIDGIKYYPDQAQKEDSASNSGIIGVLREGAAIVPSTPGNYTLPEMEIPWWNTITDELEFATIPQRSLRVIAALVSPDTANASQSQIIPPPISQTSDTVTTISVIPLWWISLTTVLGFAWMFSTYMWLSNRQAAKNQLLVAVMPGNEDEDKKTKTGHVTSLRKAYSILELSCKQNNLLDIKRSLINWGQIYFDNPHIHTLQHLRKYITESPALLALVNSLEQGLYSGEGKLNDFRPQQLLEEVSNLLKQGKPAAMKDNQYQLPPLYKN